MYVGIFKPNELDVDATEVTVSTDCLGLTVLLLFVVEVVSPVNIGEATKFPGIVWPPVNSVCESDGVLSSANILFVSGAVAIVEFPIADGIVVIYQEL